jgi:hypothetical protein
MNVIRPTLRFGILAILAATILFDTAAMVRPGKATAREDPAAADALFTNGVVHLLKIEIPNAGMRSLRRDARTYVKATVREDGTVYTNVMIRLKGGAGSFRPLDDKPGFTLKLDEASTSFHGLNKIHLNNSVQDPTYLSEWLCSEMRRKLELNCSTVFMNTYPFIGVHGRHAARFVEIVKPYINECFSYKVDFNRKWPICTKCGDVIDNRIGHALYCDDCCSAKAWRERVSSGIGVS